MQAKELKALVGQEVAVAQGWGRPTLADAGLRYRLISGPYAVEYRWVENERGGNDRVPEYVKDRGALWLVEHLDDPDHDQRYLESKRILGTWADHLAAKKVEDERRAESYRARRAAEAEADRTTDRINAAMEAGGIDWRTSIRPNHVAVAIPLTALFDLMQRAGLEPEAVPE